MQATSCVLEMGEPKYQVHEVIAQEHMLITSPMLADLHLVCKCPHGFRS